MCHHGGQLRVAGVHLALVGIPGPAGGVDDGVGACLGDQCRDPFRSCGEQVEAAGTAAGDGHDLFAGLPQGVANVPAEEAARAEDDDVHASPPCRCLAAFHQSGLSRYQATVSASPCSKEIPGS